MIKKIALGLLGIIILVTIAGLLMPSTLEVAVQRQFNQDQTTVFNTVNNLHTWRHWDAWAQKDPKMQETFEGPEFGVGQKRSWTSQHEEVGDGAQKIVANQPYTSIETELYFMPDAPPSHGYWNFENHEDHCLATWSFKYEIGQNPYAKLFMNLFIKGMIEESFNVGLENLERYLTENQQ